MILAPEPVLGVLCEVLVRGMLRSTNNLAQFGLVGFLKQLPNPLPRSVEPKQTSTIIPVIIPLRGDCGGYQALSVCSHVKNSLFKGSSF